MVPPEQHSSESEIRGKPYVAKNSNYILSVPKKLLSSVNDNQWQKSAVYLKKVSLLGVTTKLFIAATEK